MGNLIEAGESCDCFKKGFGVFVLVVVFFLNVCVLKLHIFLLFLFERDEYEKLHFFSNAGEHPHLL